MKVSKKPTVLMISDDYGLDGDCQHNAVCEGKTPVIDQLMSRHPFVKGEASGMAAGFPEGQMNSSEVGHLNVGTGRIAHQELTRITKFIQGGDFSQIPEFLTAIENCRKYNSALHMFGLVPDGDVHSHNTCIYGPLEPAKKNGLKRAYAYCFLDGCDTPSESGKGFMEQLGAEVKETGIGGVTSVMGCYYAMDRNKRWDHMELTYNALIKGEGNRTGSAAASIQASCDNGKADEFTTPFMVMKSDKPATTTQDKDSMIFYNFRSDCAREITRAFCDDSFDGFPREKRLGLVYVCFMDYDEIIQNELVASKKESITNTFDEFLTAHKETQVRVVETREYAHVAFLFNDGVEEPNENEDRTLVPFPKEVTTHDLKPEMSIDGVYDKLVEAIKSDEYDVVIINFVDPNMVGHTEIEDVAIRAIGIADACVGRVVEAIREVDGVVFIYADHGNVEQLVDYETRESFTAHTTNPVPFTLVNADPPCELYEGDALCNIIPTLIELMGMEQPKEVIGKLLLVE